MLENLERFEIQNSQLIYGGSTYGGSIVEEDAEGF